MVEVQEGTNKETTWGLVFPLSDEGTKVCLVTREVLPWGSVRVEKGKPYSDLISKGRSHSVLSFLQNALSYLPLSLKREAMLLGQSLS